MKSLLSVFSLFFFFAVFNLQAQRQMPNLQIDTLKGATPWSTLNFNNNPFNFQFAIVSDRTGGHRPGVFEDGIKKLNLLHPEFVMSVGDLIEGYTEDLDELNRQWNEFTGFIDALQFPFFYVPGNHDITNKVMEDLWIKKFGTTYYSFVYGDVLFLCMNSEDQARGAGKGTISDEQYEWVVKQLEANQNVRWTLLFMHQPLWHQQDTKRWNEIETILANRKHTVFTGHEHRYVQEKRNNGNYFVLATTGGGSALRGPKLGEFDHVVWVTMTNEGPILANLQLEGIWSENVVDVPTTAMIQRVSGKNNISIEPLFVENDQPFEQGIVKIKITNDEDVPMKVTFQERFSWDLVASLNNELEVAPNSVEIVDLELRNRKNAVANDMSPVRLNTTVSYAFENMPSLEFPSTFYVKPEPKLYLEATKAKTVNGDLSDWNNLKYTILDESSKEAVAKFDLAFDQDYLYIAAKVTDDEIKVAEGGAVFSQDYIGILINNNTLMKSATDVGAGWFRESLYMLISPEKDGIASKRFYSTAPPEGMMNVCKATATGYDMEVRIPISYLKTIQGENWKTVRINLLVGDADSRKEQQLYWFQPNWRESENRVGSGMFFRP
jgi:hypothetical protein